MATDYQVVLLEELDWPGNSKREVIKAAAEVGMQLDVATYGMLVFSFRGYPEAALRTLAKATKLCAFDHAYTRRMPEGALEVCTL